MADPIVERIAQSIKTKLDALVTAATLASAQRPARIGIPEGVGNKYAVLLQGDTTENDEQLHGFKCWVTRFEIYICVRLSDTSTASVDTTINALRADVEKKLMEDFTSGSPLFGGLADNAVVRSPDNFALGEAVAGVIVNLDVEYRHREGDPYTQA